MKSKLQKFKNRMNQQATKVIARAFSKIIERLERGQIRMVGSKEI